MHCFKFVLVLGLVMNNENRQKTWNNLVVSGGGYSEIIRHARCMVSVNKVLFYAVYKSTNGASIYNKAKTLSMATLFSTLKIYFNAII